MQWLVSLGTRIDALTLRERAFVMAGILAVTYALWSLLAVQPMEQRGRELQGNLERAQAEMAALNARTEAILVQIRNDPNVSFRTELESLKKQLDELNHNLAGTTDQLVPPGQMAQVLEAVLKGAEGLQVQSVTSLGSSPLVPDVAPKARASREAKESVESLEEADAPVRKVYKHGVKLVLQGSFFTVLDFLHKTEALTWKFFWDSLEFNVIDYPDATVEITLYTISLDPTWIGA